MKTRSYIQHHNSDSSEGLTARVQPRPFSDRQFDQPQAANPDFSHVNLFSYAPQRQPIQTKLTVGAPGDQYEQEADRVAEQVMSMPDTATQQPIQRQAAPEEEEVQMEPLVASITPVVQREALPDEEEEPVQAKPLANAIQREALPDEEEELQAKSLDIQREALPDEEEEPVQAKSLDIQREALPDEEEEPVQAKLLQRKVGSEHTEPQKKTLNPTSGDLEHRLSSSKGQGSPLSQEVRAFMEPRFGTDFSQVRVHTGGEAVQMNQELSAQAFAHGSDIYFGAGKTPGNNHLTAHELTHVVQQTGALPAKRVTESTPGTSSQPLVPRSVQRQPAISQSSLATISRSPVEVVQRDFLGDLRSTFAKITAVSRHIRQQNRIANIINQGLAIVPNPAKGTRDRDNLLHNSCEWIQQGQCQLFVLTPIHDSATRDPTQGIAYFDPLVAYPNVGGDYPTDSTVIASPHIQYGGSNDLGGLQPGGTRLEITNPQQQTDAQIKETLIHEVQHDADQTWPGQVWAVSGGASYNDYQSEFRSYWIENSEGSVDDHFGSSRRAARNDRIVSFTDPLGTEHRFRTRFSNRRQEKIFWHLVDAGYDYVPRLYTTDRAFRRMVNAFTMPVGGNLVNSVRIQAVSQALTACNTGSLRASAEVTALFTAASQLDAIDRRMLSSRRSRPFWRQARTSLSSSVYRAFNRTVVSGS